MYPCTECLQQRRHACFSLNQRSLRSEIDNLGFSKAFIGLKEVFARHAEYIELKSIGDLMVDEAAVMFPSLLERICAGKWKVL